MDLLGFGRLDTSLRLYLSLMVAMLVVPIAASAQHPIFKGYENLFTPPLNYVVYRTTSAVKVDGHLNDKAWEAAAWTEKFIDIEGSLKPAPRLETKVKMLWSDSCLYIAAELKEPHVWASLQKHDAIVFHDNDFEIFIDPDNNTHQYFEIEVNALNTIFDLFMAKPYRNKSSAMIGWNTEGLRSAVQIQGTLNNPTDTDKGWTVEMAIPFQAVSLGNSASIPTEGTLWRLNFSRVEWDTSIENGRYVIKTNAKGKKLPEHNWVWSPQGVINMHFPERWGYLQFSKKASGTVSFALPYSEKQKEFLWAIYYQQKKHYQQHKRYAPSLSELGLESLVQVGGQANKLTLEVSSRQFLATIKGQAAGKCWQIDQDGLVQVCEE
ncbi:carbohydrate-binding family 9-like protein [Adhaeribacter aquaticus]|uniref:carbohydrate-binding family 9-like protein n=1 Tax=Adhaeribacter aquaticus TaxID=299567 RepID=UPI0006865E08|nr:carbohydrate-binding family 9-like protein [Adhaeribacter aquaticus]